MKTVDDEFSGMSLFEGGKKIAHVIETRFGWVVVFEGRCDGLYKTCEAAVAAVSAEIKTRERCCGERVDDGGQNTCTRPVGHGKNDGEDADGHRCKAADVDDRIIIGGWK